MESSVWGYFLPLLLTGRGKCGIMAIMEGSKHDWHDIIPKYRLFDDPLMMACFDDKDTVQEVLRIILGREFTVTDVKVQEEVPPSQWHGAIFDVTAIDENGNKCDIEIQREDTGSLVKRAEFYSCLLGRMALDTGKDYDALMETFVIFITETDVFKHGLPIYHIERHFVETGEPFDGGSHILFVNGEYTGNDEIGQLVHDMKQDNPNKMHNKILSGRVRIFKESDEEENKMSELTMKVFEMGRDEGFSKGRDEGLCKGLSKGRDEGLNTGRVLTARAMLADNMDVSLVARYTSLPVEKVAALKAEIR